MNEVETVKVQREPVEGNPTGVVIINKEDFNPEVDKLVDASEEQTPPVAVVTNTAPVTPAADTNTQPTGQDSDGEKKPWDK